MVASKRRAGRTNLLLGELLEEGVLFRNESIAGGNLCGPLILLVLKFSAELRHIRSQTFKKKKKRGGGVE